MNETVNVFGNNFRFPGQYYDSENSFHYNYRRYYDPGAGRYLRADPIGLLGGVNSFSYSFNNPINYQDFEGLKTTYSVQSVGGGAIVTGTIGVANAKTDCTNGKRYEADYWVIGLGLNAGVKVFGKSEEVFNLLNKIFKNYSSGIVGTTFSTQDNYPPGYLSYLDIEGHNASFFYTVQFVDIEVGPYSGGRRQVKPVSGGPTGQFGVQLFKFEGIHLVRKGTPKEMKCCDK